MFMFHILPNVYAFCSLTSIFFYFKHEMSENNVFDSYHSPYGATIGYKRQGKTCRRHIGTLENWKLIS